MSKQDNCCHRCGQNFQLMESFPPEYAPVKMKGGMELCPECYRNLNEEELRNYLD
ncbi:hypothetical protein MFMK1_000706 [Metallumcola ferriviriculae]|uniref:HNH endonuclease n=1 Tax=Metallumcola ferriviriculae TaxID=3039180 RepID=A0AAU0UL58_9FIRM|nr:hypothetical protein MFMK1_000706 [Desulfitibacteraceae bacterium MK1]